MIDEIFCDKFSPTPAAIVDFLGEQGRERGKEGQKI